MFNSRAGSHISAVVMSAARDGLFLIVKLSVELYFKLRSSSARSEEAFFFFFFFWLQKIGRTSSAFGGCQRLGQCGSAAAGCLWNVWGEGVGVGVRRAADSCHGLRHSPVISPLLFTSLLPFDTLPVEIPLKAASHTLFFPHFPFCPHSHHSLTGFCSLSLVFSFLSTTFLLPQLISPHFHSLFHFISVFFFWSDFSHSGAGPPPQRSSPGRLGLTKYLPVRHLSPQALGRTDSSPSLLLAQTLHGNRPLVETLPTLCFHPAVSPSVAD